MVEDSCCCFFYYRWECYYGWEYEYDDDDDEFGCEASEDGGRGNCYEDGVDFNYVDEFGDERFQWEKEIFWAIVFDAGIVVTFTVSFSSVDTTSLKRPLFM